MLKEEAEEQMLSRMDSKDFILIDASDQAIRWEEEGKEFYLHGELYDIAKKETSNGKTMLYCINDAKEEELVKKMLKDTQTQNEQQGNKNGKHSLKTGIHDFTLPPVTGMNIPVPAAGHHHFFYVFSIIKTTKEVNTPPPNFLKS